MSTTPKYPDIRVKLSGKDGNAFAILARVTSAMRKAKIKNKDIEAFMEEAMSGNYDHLLQTCTKWVNVS